MFGLRRSFATYRVAVSVLLGLFLAAGGLVGCGGNNATVPGANHQSPQAPSVVHVDGSLARVYHNLHELKTASTIIVIGVVKSQHVETGSQPPTYTLSSLSIEQTIWSSASGSVPTSVEVRQVGGQAPDGTISTMDSFPVFSRGARYLLFLTPALAAGEYYPVGAFQGAFSIDASGLARSYSAESAQTGVYINGTPLATMIRNIQTA